ncbi:MAG: LysM peptidoglycan-binding domain-containing protein [Caldilineaceae bacterium]|nr:LysM peptidoglycan-binding domain-containing protein [Caldilineaceae bacterium]
MFPTQSKVNRTSGLWLLPVVALAMLLVGYAVFAASPAQAQVPSGDVCVEGIVIDWEENPLAGWVITLTSDITDFTPITTVSAAAPEDDDFDYYNRHDKKSKKYPFEYPENDPDLEKGEFKFSEDDIADATPGAGDLSGGALAGTYTATIETRPGWEGVTPTTISFPIEVGDDGCAQIRFKMRRIVVVTVYKIDADHLPLGDWRITAVPGPGNLFASPQQETTALTDTAATTDTAAISAGAAVFTLTPGLWIFTEQAPKTDMNDPRESYVPVVPPNGRQELLIPDPEDLDPDEAFTLVFKNELVTGCFIVRKDSFVPAPPPPNGEPVVASPVAGGYSVAGWGFQLLRKDGSVARQGVTDGRGELRFDNLPLGPYTIVEEDRAGWNEITARTLDYIVAGNACTDPADVIVFTNEQDDSGFCIEGRKIDANGGYGLAGWEIKIKALDEGGAKPVDDINADAPAEISSTLTNGLGKFRFDFLRNDYRVPGGTYEVCEQEVDGWQPHNPTCQTVRLPEWPGACVQLEDFVNQQVGHTESQDHGKGYDKDYGKGGYDNKGGNRDGGPSYGGNDIRCSEYHVVQAGEGLFDIGNQYHKSAQQMLDANPSVRDGDKLWVYEGQRICIP